MPKILPLPVIENEPLEGFLGYHLRRASVLVMADLSESLSALGLKPADASILLVLASTPGVTQSYIGRTLGILRANMTPLVAALIARGLIERQAVDGRSQALRLSPTGELIAGKASAAMREHENRLFGGLSRVARLRLIRQLRALWEK